MIAKLFFVSGTTQNPYIERVVEVINVEDKDCWQYYIDEVINCGGEYDSYIYLENLAGKKVFKEYTPADFETYVEQKRRRAGYNATSATHSNEDEKRAESSEKRNVSVKTQSRLDADYLSAVKRGDMKTAQRMVDEAAERAFAKSKIRLPYKNKTAIASMMFEKIP